jgi:hypothetical protein
MIEVVKRWLHSSAARCRDHLQKPCSRPEKRRTGRERIRADVSRETSVIMTNLLHPDLKARAQTSLAKLPPSISQRAEAMTRRRLGRA